MKKTSSFHSEDAEIQRQYEAYSHWKKSCIYDWVQMLWKYYLVEKPEITFEEYVRSNNEWKSLDTAKFQIEIWEEETKRMIEPNVNDSAK
jgi:hypothetical protein